MDALDVILSRRSVRCYSQETVTEEQIRKLLEAAQAAPCAFNTRPCHFLVLRDRETLNALAPLTPWWKLLKTCGVAVVTCVDCRILQKKPMDPEFLIVSGAAAVENMLLAASAQGLGGVWLGMCEGMKACVTFRKILGIPDWARVVGMAAFGVPEAATEAIDRSEPEKWHFERW